MSSNSIMLTVRRWPRILSEHLVPVQEPLAVALTAGEEQPPRHVAAAAARAVLYGTTLAGEPRAWPPWLAPHQMPAALRLIAILRSHGGALLADAVGLGKSYVALAIALACGEPFALVVPAVLVRQWQELLARLSLNAPIVTHERLSARSHHPLSSSPVRYRLFIVDEAHRFRNPDTHRYRALARLVVGARVLLVTATPVHNRLGDLFHLLRLFLRDHALAALGIPSLRRAAIGDGASSLASAVAARLVVSRSRERVVAGYAARSSPLALTFPRTSGERIRIGTADDALLTELVAGIHDLQAGGSAAPLVRLLLLRRLSSSLAAFRTALLRHDAYLDLAARAAAERRQLTPREFQACFPRREDDLDLQLVLFPMILDTGAAEPAQHDRDVVARLRAVLARARAQDPKAAALARLLARREARTIVFCEPRETVRHLLRALHHRRAAAIYGAKGRFAAGDATRAEVLCAFAPRAQGAAAPPSALATDVLIATDLLSEGLNLQDAERVVHYDLPWSPARLVQRNGRIDRLGSPHAAITTVTFLPPAPLADALAMEDRLAAKAAAQQVAGADGRFDWCDQLAALANDAAPGAPVSSCAAVHADRAGSVLAVRIGRLVELIVVECGVARAGGPAAARILVDSAQASARPVDRAVLQQSIECAAPLLRARLAAVQDARWRASDRDRLARRLIPWVLSSARRAARRGDSKQLGALDALVSRLALGMTAGEELLLEDLLASTETLSVKDLLGWHERLPVASEDADGAVGVELVAAVAFQPEPRGG